MGKTKKEKEINPSEDADNISDIPNKEEVREISSLPTPSNYITKFSDLAQYNNDLLLPKGFLQSEFEKLPDLSNVNLLAPFDSIINNINNLPSTVFEYRDILSDYYKSLDSIVTSVASIINLQNLKPGTVRKEKLEKEYENLEKAKDNVDEANKSAALASRTSTYGYQYLKNNINLRKNFEGYLINMTVVSIDIRDSTQLMLNAKSPKDFISFISDLSTCLSTLVKSSCGVYDKFTGDGLLCFFPSFYSGEDHVYLALSLAETCHKKFTELYSRHYGNFSVVRADVGLGIGVDTGETYLTFVNNEPTVIGTPVVYACRLSGAPSNKTYINQQVYEVIKQKYPDNFILTDCEMDFKNQGKMRVYECVSSNELNPIPLPDWVKDEVKETNQSTEKV